MLVSNLGQTLARLQTTSRKLAQAALIALLGTSCALANDFAGHGWFWYQIPPPPPKVRPLPPPPPPHPQPVHKVKPKKKGPPPLSVAWIKEYRHKYMVDAINDPTPQNVRDFMFVNKAMFDKAQNFADMFYYESHFDTALNPAFVYPHSQQALGAFYSREHAARKQLMDWYSHHAGLFFFFNSTCSYCQIQYHQLIRFFQRYPGFAHHTFLISMDGKPLPGMKDSHIFRNTTQAKFFHLVETPSIVLALPPKTFIVIAQGEIPEFEIRDQLLNAALRFHLGPKIDREGINPYGRGVISTAQFQKIAHSHLNPKQPNQVASVLNQSISSRLQSW